MPKSYRSLDNLILGKEFTYALNNYYIKKLIGFKGIILEQLETSSDWSFPFSLEIKTHNYPKCHQQTSKVTDSELNVKDISIQGKNSLFWSF